MQTRMDWFIMENLGKEDYDEIGLDSEELQILYFIAEHPELENYYLANAV